MTEDIKKLEASLNAYLEELKTEFTSLRSNRPNAKMVEDIKVSAYGTPLPIKQLGSISIIPPREITITLWDALLVKSASESIADSLDVTPRIDGATIHINLPTLTEERKKELNKIISKTAEEWRIKIRNSRDSLNKKIESMTKSGNLSEDDKFSFKSQVQKIVDQTNEKIESLLQVKAKEINE